MECPHCNQEIPGKECPSCSHVVPEESRFCMACGESIPDVSENVIEEEGAFDIDSRVRCPDGNCTGIIIGGKCIECGKPHKQG